MTPSRIHAAFPAPSFRGAQEQALHDIQAAFDGVDGQSPSASGTSSRSGNDVVLVRAPTGSGKSLIARAIMGTARRVEDADPHQATGAYYTTPQVSQLDDVAEDDLLDDLKIIRGKNNYSCILPGEETTPVDRAPCARTRGYDCAVKHRCPYFSARAIASARENAAMTLAYFMRTAGSDVFRKRDVCVIDEAHGLAEWAEMYATIHLGPHRVPVWDDVRVPDVGNSVESASTFAETLQNVCEGAKNDLLDADELSAEEAARRDRLQELISELDWFIEDYRDPESATTWVVDQQDSGEITVKPMNPERYLMHTVWDRANRFALLSATILNKEAFCRGVGLDPSNVAMVDVEHTFPVENRPLYNVAQGKMTFEHREQTLPHVADAVARAMCMHPDEKGLVHCHSYDIQEKLEAELEGFGVGDRIRSHTTDDRNAQLETWKAASNPEVFLSVKMEEALDLKYDLARWQVLCKAPFLNTGDSRVAKRLSDGQWAWYYRAALRTIIQGCGRVVRAPDDTGITYIADESILDLFERARTDMPPWFMEQVDRMERPDLPEFDASAALSGMSGSVDQSKTDTSPSGETTGETPTGAATENSDSERDSFDSQHALDQTPSNDRATSRDRNSPLADVWDTD